MQYVEKTLTIEEIEKQKDEDNYIKGNVLVDIEDIIDMDRDNFIYMLSNTLTGSDVLMDVSYTVIGSENGLIGITVSGDVSNII